MSLARQISEWKEYPNSLGSEARAAVLVADVASALGEPVPRPVTQALRQLALRGTLRDLAVELRGDQLRVSSVDFDDVCHHCHRCVWIHGIRPLPRCLGVLEEHGLRG